MSKILLKNVRISFPSIFQKAVFDGTVGKYECTFLIDKSDEKLKAQLDAAIAEVIKASGIKVAGDKICLKNGDDSTYDGYAGTWSLKAANSKRPTLINRDKSPIIEDDELLYAGAYCNAVIDFWVMNNAFGKRVNANLHGIQFVKHGEPFGAGNIDVFDDFDDLDGDGSDDDIGF